MTAQYLRKVQLVVGNAAGQGLDLSELQIRFMVRRGDYQTPNSVDIRIYNVSDDTAKALLTGNQLNQTIDGSAEFSQVQLSCGYDGQYGLIFSGNIMQVRRGRDSAADTYIDIRAADGDAAYNFAVINTTLAAGSTPQQQLDVIAKAMGLPLGYVSPLPNTALPRGKVLYGMARDALRDFAKTYNASWSIQDGKIQIRSLAQFVPGDIVAINSASGMIGWPEQTANGIHIRCLLNPNIKIGNVVQINNASIQDYQIPISLGYEVDKALVPRTDWDGYYVVYVAEHSGDTRGQEWYTDIIALAANGKGYIPLGTLNRTVTPTLGQSFVNPYG